MHVAFNQDVSCVVTGTEHGFRVYNCAPFGKFFTSDAQSGLDGVGLARMLFSTSLVAVVGNGELNSPRRLTIVNTRRSPSQTPICELTFPTSVRNLLLNRQRLVVVLDAQIYIYNIANMKLLYTLDTVVNKLGVSSITPRVSTLAPIANMAPSPVAKSDDGVLTSAASIHSSSSENAPQTETASLHNPAADLARVVNNWLVYPAPPRTRHHLAPSKHASEAPKAPQGDVVVFDMTTLAPVTVISAHRSPLALLVLNEDGSLLATTSDKGTLVRVFAIPSGTLLYEFRRGSYQSTVYSIAFGRGSQLLCVSSATQTVHVYKLDESHQVKHKSAAISSPPHLSPADELGDLQISRKPKKHWFPRSAWPPSGTQSTPKRDFAYFRLPLKPTTRTTVGMPPLANRIYVATESGQLFHYALDPDRGGECTRVAEYALD